MRGVYIQITKHNLHAVQRIGHREQRYTQISSLNVMSLWNCIHPIYIVHGTRYTVQTFAQQTFYFVLVLLAFISFEFFLTFIFALAMRVEALVFTVALYISFKLIFNLLCECNNSKCEQQRTFAKCYEKNVFVFRFSFSHLWAHSTLVRMHNINYLLDGLLKGV